MADLFRQWGRRVDDNARRAVEAYQNELSDYRTMAANPRARAGMLDFAVFLRRRTVAQAADDQPFTDQDLGFMAAVGRQRGELGLSLSGQRQVLLLHTKLTLQEVYEAAGPSDLETTMRALAWLAPAGLAAQSAFTRGYLEGQKRFLPAVARVRMLAAMLLAGDSAAPHLARSLQMAVPDQVLVTVVRVAGAAPPPGDELVDTLLKRYWLPLTWYDPDELVAVVPAATDRAAGPGPVPAAVARGPVEPDPATSDRALGLARDLAGLLGRPCAVGTASGQPPDLAEAVALARQVSRTAPVEAVPRHAYTAVDLFAELGAAQMPGVDQWLRALGQRLSAGPDLVATLDSYYRTDMNRLATAAALRIHPRTLDYRLQRVRDLTGLDPGSTRGVRVLTTAVARLLAGA